MSRVGPAKKKDAEDDGTNSDEGVHEMAFPVLAAAADVPHRCGRLYPTRKTPAGQEPIANNSPNIATICSAPSARLLQFAQNTASGWRRCAHDYDASFASIHRKQ
jgi:hypothetical protein